MVSISVLVPASNPLPPLLLLAAELSCTMKKVAESASTKRRGGSTPAIRAPARNEQPRVPPFGSLPKPSSCDDVAGIDDAPFPTSTTRLVSVERAAAAGSSKGVTFG